MKKFLWTLPAFIHKPCHPLRLLQNTTASEFTSKYWSGKVVVTKLGLWTGDGRRVMENLCQYSPTCHQLQMNFWKWSGVTVTLTAAVWGAHERNTMCNVLLLVATAEGQAHCRGSGCTNSNNPTRGWRWYRWQYWVNVIFYHNTSLLDYFIIECILFSPILYLKKSFLSSESCFDPCMHTLIMYINWPEKMHSVAVNFFVVSLHEIPRDF